MCISDIRVNRYVACAPFIKENFVFFLSKFLENKWKVSSHLGIDMLSKMSIEMLTLEINYETMTCAYLDYLELKCSVQIDQ